jgi:tRNA(Ile)-lysidine synthase
MTRHPLTERLACETADLVREPRRLVVAVSGGADSVALLRGLHGLRDDLKLSLHVAHLDHQLRGKAARDDADWVGCLCKSLAISCIIGRADIAGIAQQSGRGFEETARDERYRFLEETARAHDCRVISLAHTADDQAETILHHILRGTGLTGLSGIPRERALDSGIRLVRPLLGVERSVVLDYLAQIGQDFREDESNRDEAYTRNRLRHELLPLLAGQYNPHIRSSLRRLGEQAAQTQAALEVLAADLLERVLDSATAEVCRLKWQPLTGVPRHLIREVLSQLWRRQNWPRQKMGFEHWDALAEIAVSGSAGTFPGKIDVRREGRWMVLSRDRPLDCHSRNG